MSNDVLDDLQEKVIVDDKQLSLQEFEKLKADPTMKLVEVSPGIFKTLKRLYG